LILIRPHPANLFVNLRWEKLTDYDTVVDFGKSCDLVTIEIEHVNVEAMKELVRRGRKVFPQPEVIELIQDKRKQKQFYKSGNIPTADFLMVENRQDIFAKKSFLPAVNKLGREGYDGRGVRVLRTEDDLSNAFDAPGLLEKLIDFEKEISVIVARNERGETQTFPLWRWSSTRKRTWLNTFSRQRRSAGPSRRRRTGSPGK